LIDSITRAFVIRRAGNLCEYCRLPQLGYEAAFNIDHVIATQHQRDNSSENLALSCPKCNRKKGPNISSIDPVTKAVVRLFNPRTDLWTDHFAWRGITNHGVDANWPSNRFPFGLEQ
jgi:hypothetical protein